MSCWALVPLKQRQLGKTRLAGVLGIEARARLIQSMLSAVIDAISRAHTVDHIAIVTAEEETARAGVLTLPDRGHGLNGALADATATLVALGAQELLVMHADLPLVRPDEIDTFVCAGRARGMAVAPDRHGAGTNALFLTLPSRLRFCFGERSLDLHLAAARGLGIDPALTELPGFALDIDTPGDLACLATPAGECTPRFTPRFWSQTSCTPRRHSC